MRQSTSQRLAGAPLPVRLWYRLRDLKKRAWRRFQAARSWMSLGVKLRAVISYLQISLLLLDSFRAVPYLP